MAQYPGDDKGKTLAVTENSPTFSVERGGRNINFLVEGREFLLFHQVLSALSHSAIMTNMRTLKKLHQQHGENASVSRYLTKC